MDNYRQLLAYKYEHGSTLVPYKFKQDPQLGRWVSNQRSHYRSKELSKERIDLLESIGFVWDVPEMQWKANFTQLLAFKEEHGHTQVPWKYKANTKLAYWVDNQRSRKDTMPEKRVKLLNSIGFVWDART